jgi:hypothetical protein
VSLTVIDATELAYARERVLAWFVEVYPHWTLAEVDAVAYLVALERQKAAAEVAGRSLQ